MIVYFKPTYQCNMNCSYCIIKNVDEPFKDNPVEFLSQYNENSHIIFHGGEPTLKPVSYYEEILDRLGNKYTFSFQTNLIIKDIDKWIPIFKRVEYISTSNDFDNIERSGMDVKLWESNFKRLMEEQVSTQIIITLHKNNIKTFKDELLRFFDKFKCYKEKFSIRLNYLKPVIPETKSMLLSQGEFANAIIDIYQSFEGQLRIENVEDFKELKAYMEEGRLSTKCMYSSLCYNDYRHHKYTCSGLEDLRIEKPFIDRFDYLRDNDCKGCEYFSICQGGCVIDSLTFYNTAYKKSYICYDYKILFDYFVKNIKGHHLLTER